MLYYGSSSLTSRNSYSCPTQPIISAPPERVLESHPTHTHIYIHTPFFLPLIWPFRLGQIELRSRIPLRGFLLLRSARAHSYRHPFALDMNLRVLYYMIDYLMYSECMTYVPRCVRQDVKLEGSERVGVCDRLTGRRVPSTSNEAPTVHTLKDFLRAHRTHDVLRPATVASVAPTPAPGFAIPQSPQPISSQSAASALPAAIPPSAAAAASGAITLSTKYINDLPESTSGGTPSQIIQTPLIAVAVGSAGDHSDTALPLSAVGHIPPIRIQVRRVLTQMLQERCASASSIATIYLVVTSLN